MMLGPFGHPRLPRTVQSFRRLIVVGTFGTSALPLLRARDLAYHKKVKLSVERISLKGPHGGSCPQKRFTLR